MVTRVFSYINKFLDFNGFGSLSIPLELQSSKDQVYVKLFQKNSFMQKP